MSSINKKPSEAPSTEGTQKVFYAAILGGSGAPQTYTSFRSLSTTFIEKQFTKCAHSLASSRVPQMVSTCHAIYGEKRAPSKSRNVGLSSVRSFSTTAIAYNV
jgi:hypothetical protein